MNKLTEEQKYYKARQIAEKMQIVANAIQDINDDLLQNDLNLENYPENWQSFDEFPEMLRDIFVSDFSKLPGVQVSVNDILAENIK